MLYTSRADLTSSFAVCILFLSLLLTPLAFGTILSKIDSTLVFFLVLEEIFQFSSYSCTVG